MSRTTLQSNSDDDLAEWVRVTLAGDRQAFGHLVAATWSSLVALARVTLAEQHDRAEDVVQESYCRAWRDLPSLRDERAFRPWMHRIVVRAALRERKHGRRERDRLSEAGDRGSVLHPQPDGGVERALSRLPVRQRTVLYLGEIEGYSDAEVARALGIRPATVRVHRQRGRRRLRELLGLTGAVESEETSRTMVGRAMTRIRR